MSASLEPDQTASPANAVDAMEREELNRSISFFSFSGDSRVSELELRRRPTRSVPPPPSTISSTPRRCCSRTSAGTASPPNLLAARAIGVQTLYRYFPNKLSVVATLAERKIEEWDAWAEHVSDLLRPGETDWGRGIHVCLDGLRNQPGGIAIRRAMGRIADPSNSTGRITFASLVASLRRSWQSIRR